MKDIMNCIVCGKPDITPSDDKVQWIAHARCYQDNGGKDGCYNLYKERGKLKKWQNPLKKRKSK